MKSVQLAILCFVAITSIDRACADWACDGHDSILRDDGEISICGESSDVSVDQAKKWAFHEAHMEFWRLCMASSTCKGYEVTIVPERMDCTEKPFKTYFHDTKWTCKRSIRFIVDRSKRKCDEQGKDMFHGCPMNRMPFDGV